MTKVIGVRFRTAGKVYFFDPLQLEIKRGDHVIVETARGIEFGTVVAGVHEVEVDKVIQPLKPVMRIAGERDIEQEAANKEKEKEAFKICKEKILKHGLEMKLIDAEYTFDNNKVLFYFTAVRNVPRHPATPLPGCSGLPARKRASVSPQYTSCGTG